MKAVILALLLVVNGIYSSSSQASGSNTVFLPAKARQFYVTPAVRDIVTNPQLKDYLEQIQYQSYVIKVSPRLFQTAAYYAGCGYTVRIKFEGYESIDFDYYSELDAIMGFSSYGNPVLLDYFE